MRLVLTENLTPQMTLARNVYKMGCVYLKAGQRNISKYRERLEDLGVDYVYIHDEASEGIEIPEVVSEETRHKCQDALRTTFSTLENNMPIDVNMFKGPVNTLMAEIMNNSEVQVSLTDISSMDEYTFGHSVSTAVYSLIIGQELKLPKDQLQELAMGAILHDVGKVRLDSRVLFKETKLTDSEFEQIRKHPEYSFEILKYCRNMSNDAKMISFTHHERLDGSGYPRHLKGNQLSLFSRIVAVADVYDALSTNRCYRKAWPVNKVVDFLTKIAGTELDNELVAALIKKVAIFPNGTEVKLSDGSYAIVVSQNEQMPFRPVVRVVRDADMNAVHPYGIDLMRDLNITIVASQMELEMEEEEQKKIIV
ncbi:MAG: HD-GYP domain-containing protein [Firmicutes bacterium]|nr:HD-GYP domain-containing protein [Bacillota bacterium]